MREAGADAVIVDLEDAVAPDAKDAARAALQAWLAGADARGRVVVRINAAGTPWLGADLRAVRAAGEEVAADDVVVACGIWGPAVAAFAGVDLPLTPVAHPYLHGLGFPTVPSNTESGVGRTISRWLS